MLKHAVHAAMIVAVASSAACSSAEAPAPANDNVSAPLPASITRTLSAIPSLDDARSVLGPSAEFEQTTQGKTLSVGGACSLDAVAQGWRADTYSAEDRRVIVDISVVAYPSEEDAARAARTLTSDTPECNKTLETDLLFGLNRNPPIIEVNEYTGNAPGGVLFNSGADGTPCSSLITPASTALVSVLSCVPGPNTNNAYRASTTLLSKVVGNVYAANGRD